MSLNKNLVLFKYILNQLGYLDFEDLREKFRSKITGTDSSGRSHFVNDLLGESELKLDQQTLLQYDEAILGYEEKLRVNRAEPALSLKYYQWLALLYSEYFLDQLSSDEIRFRHSLNEFKNSNRDFQGIADYELHDLKKMAYWMATGSGKTLIMHCNYWQLLKYFKNWQNIILITPNEGLSEQHLESLHTSGIKAKRYTGSEEGLIAHEGEVLIIEITKLVKEKQGEGVTVGVDSFSEDYNLVFIDEGHKGQSGRSATEEKRAWRAIKDHLVAGPHSFTSEYSATFGQIISGRSGHVFQEYSKTILFDYSYRHFYSDGYGKDFAVFNIDERETYSNDQQRLLLTAGLLGFYEQLDLYRHFENELRTYNIEKPLWIFVGSRVIGRNGSNLTVADKTNISDVTRILSYFRNILAQPEKLDEDVKSILFGQSNLNNERGRDIFEGRFEHVRRTEPSAEEILQTVFHGIGQIEAWHIKQADGEIGLKTKTSDRYFAVINIGDVPKYAKKLEEDLNGEILVQDENIKSSLFRDLDATDSDVHVLIGSKKFIEGWNSWRVSSMGLMNMGKKEGAQIIQLFGRGVRLKGRGLSLQREDEQAAYHIRALQTISIFGLNASYMNDFLQNIEKETPEYSYYPVPVVFNNNESWEGRVVTFKTDDRHRFKDYLITLQCEEKILNRITVDMRNRVSVAVGGFNSQVADDQYIYEYNVLKKYFSFLDFNKLELELKTHCLLHYDNLVVTRDALCEIVKKIPDDAFKFVDGQFGLQQAVDGTMQRIAFNLLKDYIGKYYSDKEKDYLTRTLTFDYLTEKEYPEVFPDDKQMIIKAPKNRSKAVDELIANIQEFYQKDIEAIPTVHFDRHLYSPLAVWKKGSDYQEIKTVPVKLNEGETRFLDDLRKYLITAQKKFESKEVYVLRNLSRKGVGFFIESSSFFPDFILWIVDGNKQRILFLDPKGIRHLGNFDDPKVVFCSETVSEINQDIREKINKEQADLDISLDAYILSVSKYNDIKDSWGESHATLQDFQEHHVLFMDRDKEYLRVLFG